MPRARLVSGRLRCDRVPDATAALLPWRSLVRPWLRPRGTRLGAAVALSGRGADVDVSSRTACIAAA